MRSIVTPRLREKREPLKGASRFPYKVETPLASPSRFCFRLVAKAAGPLAWMLDNQSRGGYRFCLPAVASAGLALTRAERRSRRAVDPEMGVARTV